MKITKIDEQTPVNWETGEEIHLGDVVRCGNYLGAVYWCDYLKTYQVSVGTGLTLYHNNLNRLEFVSRGNNKLCECGRPYPVVCEGVMFCQCSRQLEPPNKSLNAELPAGVDCGAVGYSRGERLTDGCL